MKLHRAKLNCSGLTLIEVLVVIAIVVVLIAMLLPYLAGGGPAKGPESMNNQKQIALGFIMWQVDNNNKLPWQVPETNHGILEICEHGDAADDFNTLRDYIKQSRLFVCPTDPVKKPAPDQTLPTTQNISYFVGFEAATNTTDAAFRILTGDRNLQIAGTSVKPGLFTYTTNFVMGWTPELHNKANPAGYVSFYDGHVGMERGVHINSAFQSQGLATARYAVP